MRGRVEAMYRPAGERGEIVVYAGDLAVTVGDLKPRPVRGQLELRLSGAPRFFARFVGPHSQLDFLDPWSGVERSVAVPHTAPLTPPTESVLPEDPGDISWVDDRITMNELEAGVATVAKRFVFHISGALQSSSFPNVEVLGGGRQPQLRFGLSGWDLVIAQVDGRGGENGFGFVVEGRPEFPISSADVDKLRRRLFILLSFMAGREVGVGPVCGLDDDGDLIWAKWAVPRMRPGRPGVRWCPPILFATAFSEIVEGVGGLSKDVLREAVVERAINHLLAANGNEPLDVRVPIACSGLEMLGTAVLQRHGKKVPGQAACKVRQLLVWAGVPVTIPAGFASLAARSGRHTTIADGPEVLFGIRNKLVHPPMKMTEWPSSAELKESWQLANWYLELVVLRELDYEGKYWSRLRLGRQAADLEPVPWA